MNLVVQEGYGHNYYHWYHYKSGYSHFVGGSLNPVRSCINSTSMGDYEPAYGCTLSVINELHCRLIGIGIGAVNVINGYCIGSLVALGCNYFSNTFDMIGVYVAPVNWSFWASPNLVMGIVAGLVNRIGGGLDSDRCVGLVVGLFYNTVRCSMIGLSLSLGFQHSEYLRGVQLGVLNSCGEKSTGLQIGLLNFRTGSYLPIPFLAIRRRI